MNPSSIGVHGPFSGAFQPELKWHTRLRTALESPVVRPANLVMTARVRGSQPTEPDPEVGDLPAFTLTGLSEAAERGMKKGLTCWLFECAAADLHDPALMAVRRLKADLGPEFCVLAAVKPDASRAADAKALDAAEAGADLILLEVDHADAVHDARGLLDSNGWERIPLAPVLRFSMAFSPTSFAQRFQGMPAGWYGVSHGLHELDRMAALAQHTARPLVGFQDRQAVHMAARYFDGELDREQAWYKAQVAALCRAGARLVVSHGALRAVDEGWFT